MENINLIYILGVSLSGSTILGFAVGSHPHVELLGELEGLYRLNEEGRDCACGQKVKECEIWSHIDPDKYPIYDRRQKGKKIWDAMGIVVGKKVKENSINTPEYDFLLKVKQVFAANNQYPTHFIDSSKTLWRLKEYHQTKGISVQVIYIRRGLHANIASFLKSKRSFFSGIFIYTLQHWMIKRFFKKNQEIPRLTINHEDFCTQTGRFFSDLNAFTGLDYSNYKKVTQEKKIHMWEGNLGPLYQFRAKNFEIKLSTSWKSRLTNRQTKFLDFWKNQVIDRFIFTD